MTEQQLFDVYTGRNEFVMRAPMEVIAAVFQVNREGVRRVMSELENHPEQKVWFQFNGKQKLSAIAVWLNLDAITVEFAGLR